MLVVRGQSLPPLSRESRLLLHAGEVRVLVREGDGELSDKQSWRGERTTMIPSGGWAEVEWGVQTTHPRAAATVENFGADQELARLVAAHREPRANEQITLVAREVTYGPWAECKQ